MSSTPPMCQSNEVLTLHGQTGAVIFHRPCGLQVSKTQLYVISHSVEVSGLECDSLLIPKPWFLASGISSSLYQCHSQATHFTVDLPSPEGWLKILGEPQEPLLGKCSDLAFQYVYPKRTCGPPLECLGIQPTAHSLRSGETRQDGVRVLHKVGAVEKHPVCIRVHYFFLKSWGLRACSGMNTELSSNSFYCETSFIHVHGSVKIKCFHNI
jgi:hypothetical protein